MRFRLTASLLAMLGGLPLQLAGAQAVLLRLSPRPGDTLHVRLEQQVEVTGTTRVEDADSSMSAVSSMLLFSRTIVQRSDASGSTVLTITDSVSLSSSPAQLPPATVARLQRALMGQQIRMRIAPDGAAEVLEAPGTVEPDIQALISQMPAALPSRRVSVGERWTHLMNLPTPGRPGLAGPLSLKVSFRLDSLGRGGRLAFISMRGELTHADEEELLPGGARHRTMTDSLQGYLIVDRQRGWMTESHSVLSVRSVIEPPAAAGVEPMHVRMRITQKARTLDKR